MAKNKNAKQPIPKAKQVKAKTIKPEDYLYILTNERTEMKANMLLMLYKAVSIGQLGYMDGMDPDSGEIVPLLVGFQPTENGKFNVFPLARIFNKVDGIPHYLVPDGQGGYLDYRTDEQRLEPPAHESVGADRGDNPPVEAREEDRPAEEVGASIN